MVDEWLVLYEPTHEWRALQIERVLLFAMENGTLQIAYYEEPEGKPELKEQRQVKSCVKEWVYGECGLSGLQVGEMNGYLASNRLAYYY